MSKVRRVNWKEVRAARANLRRLAGKHPELTTAPSGANRAGWEATLEDAMAEETKSEQLVVRLPASLMKQLDAYAERLREEMPGATWKRSDVARMLLVRALEQVAAPATKKAKR
jgi:hypothetical protein